MPTSYTTVSAALLTVIRLLTNTWDADNTSEGDTRVIDEGTDRWMILNAGPSQHMEARAGYTKRSWDVVLDMGRRVAGNDVEAKAAFVADRDELLAHLEKYPTLNNTATVKRVRIDAIGDVSSIPVDPDFAEGTVAFFWQGINVNVVVEYAVTGGEY